MDRWIFVFGVMAAIIIVLIMSNPLLLSRNQELIVEKIDNSTKFRTEQIEKQNAERDKQFQQEAIERERLFQDAKIEILNNMTNKLDANTELLRELMMGHNFTITLDENTTEQLRGPQGAQGANGTQGETGLQGPQGKTGERGERGEHANP